MAKFRVRVKGSRAYKLPNGSSASNSKSSKFRNAAKAQRIAKIFPMVAVDDQLRTGKSVLDSLLDKHLPLKEMSLSGGDRKRARRDSEQTSKTEGEQQKFAKIEQLSVQKTEIGCATEKKLSKREQQLWKLLPPKFTSSSMPLDLQTAMPMLAPILSAALKEPGPRLTAITSIRAALQVDLESGSTKIMEQYAKTFLPILFNIYTNDDDEDEVDVGRKFDPIAVHQSALATIRLYMQQMVPKSLLKQYIPIIMRKLVVNSDSNCKAEGGGGGGSSNDKMILLADILIAMCISADAEDLQTIFDSIKPWFDGAERWQKKAYRLMAEIYKRIGEEELKHFFARNRPFLENLIESDIENVHGSSLQWRAAIFRNVISSLSEFEELLSFCHSIFDEVLALLNTQNSKPTRHQSANCLLEMTRELLRVWTLEENKSLPNPLDAFFDKLIVYLKNCIKTCGEKIPDIEERDFRCALIALNILTQKHLRHINGSTIAQLIGCASEALRMTTMESSARLLAIRLIRTICSKMQPFIFEQYKDIVINAVFSQPIASSTVRTRKANSILLDLLLDRTGVEELLTFASGSTNFVVWSKILKNLEKIRRRRVRRKSGGGGASGELSNSASSGVSGSVARRGEKSLFTGAASSIVSRSSSNAAISTLLTLGARTANADSIFDILSSSDSSEDERDGKRNLNQNRKSKRKHHNTKLSVLIEEGCGDEEGEDGEKEEEEEEDPLDLLDPKALQRKVTFAKVKERRQIEGGGGGEVRRGKRSQFDDEEEENEEKEKNGRQPFRINDEGRLLITNLDRKRSAKKRMKKEEKDGDEEEKEGEKEGEEQCEEGNGLEEEEDENNAFSSCEEN